MPAGVDGEALVFDPPVRFVTRPQALRVRIAPQHPGASPSAVMPDRPRQMLAALAALAFRGAFADPPTVSRDPGAVV